MVSWKEMSGAEPEFADHIQRTFAVRKHATMATTRRDGSPRISGTEIEFDGDGEIYLGMMLGARRATDLRRDPRMALHSPTVDPPDGNPAGWLGEGKISGTAIEVSDPSPSAEAHRFRIDVTEVVLTRVGTPADHLLISVWHQAHGLRHIRR